MYLSWQAKDPDEVLDYRVDWSGRLSDETITASLWIVPAGLTKTNEQFDGTAATIWLSGGTALKTYQLTNRVTTSAGRTLDQTVYLPIRSE